MEATEGWFENGESSDPVEVKKYYFRDEKLICTYRGPTFEGEYEGKGIVEFDDGNYFIGSFISG